ncbi:uncharacterized protein LOC141911013 [Tubulanus polymorphus]|uniref:uncharacterized protein LOC141911013 n=1 Tax=Tubulanus polymorphus TaxID=672921 RepID=UPI003DA3EE23
MSKTKIAIISNEAMDVGTSKICIDGLREDVKERYDFMNIIRSADEDIFDFTERCIDIVKNEQITGVLGLRDIAAIISAAICERLPQLPGPSLKSVAIALHKYYTRLYFAKEQGGINYRLLRYDAAPTEIHDVLNQIGFPCFVKPCSGTHSVGAIEIKSVDDLRRHLEIYETLKLEKKWERFNDGFLSKVGAPCPEDALIVEEFKDYTNFFFAEGLVASGQIIHWDIVDCNFWKSNPIVMSNMTCPSRLAEDVQREIWKICDIIVQRMIDHGFNNQFFTTEMCLMADGGIKLIEVNHRITSNISPMYRSCLSNGDSFEALLDVNRGIIPRTPTRNGHHCMTGMLATFTTDKMKNLLDFEAMKQYPEVQTWLDPECQVTYVGDKVGTIIGMVYVRAPTYEEQYEKFLKIAKEVLKQPEYSLWE